MSHFDVIVVGAGHAGLELRRAIPREHEMGVRVDPAGQDGAAGRVEALVRRRCRTRGADSSTTAASRSRPPTPPPSASSFVVSSPMRSISREVISRPFFLVSAPSHHGSCDPLRGRRMTDRCAAAG